jgi:hypothetical protein
MAHCPRYLQAVAACQLTPRPAHPLEMTTKSRQRVYGASIRASAQCAKEARKEGRPARMRGLEHAAARLHRAGVAH